MGTSNIRKLKKKYKAESVAGIEVLIELYKEIEQDTSELEYVLQFCKSIKAGNFGKRIYRDDSGEAIHNDWRIKSDFHEFNHLNKRYRLSYKHRTENSRYYTLTLKEYLTENFEDISKRINEQINKINEKYRMEHRDILINSLLDE